MSGLRIWQFIKKPGTKRNRDLVTPERVRVWIEEVLERTRDGKRQEALQWYATEMREIATAYTLIAGELEAAL